MDAGHEATDKMIEDIEKELLYNYTEAYKKIKVELYKNIEKLIETSDIAERERLLNRTTRLHKLCLQMAKEIKEVNKTSVDIVNNNLYNAYAVNYEYGTYLLEHTSGYDTGFNMFNRNAIKEIVKGELTPFTKMAYNGMIDRDIIVRELTRQLTQGILLGEGIGGLSKRIKLVMDNNMNDAVRIARTEITRVENAGRYDAFKRGEGMGLKLKKKWISTIDGRTRTSHAHLMGEEVDLDKPFSNGLMYPASIGGKPSEVINCFIGETIVFSDSPIKNSFCHKYEGELITVKTSSGIEFTGTPNHPILTNKGWVSLGSINEGDHLAIGAIEDNWVSRINPNVDTINTSMVQIHNSFKSVFHSKRVAGALVNFHGYIPNSDIEIVFVESFLLNRIKSELDKFVEKVNFKFADFMERFLVSQSFFNKFLFGGTFLPSSNVTLKSKFLSFLKRSVSHSGIHRFTSISSRDKVTFKDSVDDTPGNIEAFSECLNGFTGSVSFDNVVFVKKMFDSCHVYNLHTENNLYLVNNSITQGEQKGNGNGVIVHNCRCTHIVEFEGLEKDAEELKMDEKLERMSFKQWGGLK